jgi:hypothetical protein
MRIALTVIALVAVCATKPVATSQSPANAAFRAAFDEILDVNVRDGFVYYRALKLDRARLDRIVNSLATAAVNRLPRNEQVAFWLNAYNALVLRTVIDHYPIPVRSTDYPQRSIRQIPGAFERLTHRVASRVLTLDQIEQTILPMFDDPRVYLALGRGAVGGGRLRSEAFAPDRIEAQLAEVAGECPSRPQCVYVDRVNDQIRASAIFSWRENEFVGAYAQRAPALFASRSPMERAILAFIEPKLLTVEREFLEKNAFRLVYQPFDWTLNDLTGRGGR